MKKNVKAFINYLEKETPITCDLSTISPTQTITNINNELLLVNVVAINNGDFGLSIFSCGCENCDNVLDVEILYGGNDGENELPEAKLIQNQIRKAFPDMTVELRNVNTLNDNSQLN